MGCDFLNNTHKELQWGVTMRYMYYQDYLETDDQYKEYMACINQLRKKLWNRGLTFWRGGGAKKQLKYPKEKVRISKGGSKPKGMGGHPKDNFPQKGGREVWTMVNYQFRNRGLTFCRGGGGFMWNPVNIP